MLKAVSSSRKVRWGILAAGKIAHTFAEAMSACPGSSLSGIASRDAGRSQAFAEKHGISKAYLDYAELLADPEIDAVYLATIHPRHLELMLQSIQAGKHVLCEKPLAMNLHQARQAQKMAKEKRRLLREAFMYRHHPQIQEVADWVASGRIGKVRMIHASFCFDGGDQPDSRLLDKQLGGGAILDVGGYAMSFARLIAGRAVGRLFAEPIELKAVGHLDSTTGADTWTTASMRFEGDILAETTAAVRLNGATRAEIYGELGQIAIDRPWFSKSPAVVTLNGSEPEIVQPSKVNAYACEIEAFANELCGVPIAPNAVGMRFDDTLGNMKALDWWRAEIGLRYEADRVHS